MAGATTTTKGPLILRCKKSNDAAAAATTASATNASCSSNANTKTASSATSTSKGSRSKLQQQLRRRSMSEGDLLCEIDNALVLSKGFLFARGNERYLAYENSLCSILNMCMCVCVLVDFVYQA